MRKSLRNRRTLTPGVESLEQMTLLSGLAAPAVAHAAHVAMPTALAIAKTAINVTTHGNYVRVQSNPDTGSTYSIFTIGTVSGIGPVGVAGSVHTPGFIRNARVTGTLTVYSAKGTLTLAISSAPQPGFSPLPSLLTFKVTGGTGQFRGASGTGTIDVVLHQVTGTTGPKFTSGGTATLTFHSTSAAV